MEKNRVIFKDGSSEEIDLVILATGYEQKFPYLDKTFFKWTGNRPNTHLRVFNKEHPTLFTNGYIETNSGAYKLFDDMAYIIARAIKAQLSNKEEWNQPLCWSEPSKYIEAGHIKSFLFSKT